MKIEVIILISDKLYFRHARLPNIIHITRILCTDKGVSQKT